MKPGCNGCGTCAGCIGRYFRRSAVESEKFWTVEDRESAERFRAFAKRSNARYRTEIDQILNAEVVGGA